MRNQASTPTNDPSVDDYQSITKDELKQRNKNKKRKETDI